MEDSEIANAATSLGPRPELLGDLQIDGSETRPLGGLNPHNDNFDKVGQQLLRLVIEHTGLQPTHNILDLGCGTGRLTKQLENVLDGGLYVGSDVNQRYLDYCRQTYRSEFKFDFWDVHNDEFNPSGRQLAADYVFPFGNQTFDVVVAIALFNHMHTKGVFQYIHQVARVLRPQGLFFCTAFLLNSASMSFIEGHRRRPFKFDFRTPDSWHEYESRLLFNVALPEEGIRRAFIKSNLMIREPIRYGQWCGSSIALTGHDVIVARKF